MLVFRFLSSGFTQATLALSGKIFCLKLFFIAVESDELKGSAAILIKARGILSSTIAFLGLSCCSSFRTSPLLTGKNILLLLFPRVLILLFVFNSEDGFYMSCIKIQQLLYSFLYNDFWLCLSVFDQQISQ